MRLQKYKADIFGELFILANRLQILGDRIDPDVTIKQWLFLAVIPQCEGRAPTMTEISGMMGSSHQNAKKMALLLEKRGFVRLCGDPDDARVTRVAVTEKCEEYFKIKEPEELAFIETLFSGFSDEQLLALHSGLRKLMENMMKMETEYEKKG